MPEGTRSPRPPFTPLPREFYLQPVVDAARSLLGCLLIRLDEDPPLIGRIVETEAYTATDPSSHSFRGPTARNASMFGPAGHAYVYLIYGYHHCLNLVVSPEGTADAVLIRALEPVQGMDAMAARRGARTGKGGSNRGGTASDTQLLSGPGRLCQAFGIDRSFDGEDVVEGRRLIAAPGSGLPPKIGVRRRIGLSHPEASAYPWRFVEEGSPFLSRP